MGRVAGKVAIDCGPFAGDADGFVAFAQGFLANCKGSQHTIGQAQIRG
jgi:hypothetical protein